MAIFSKDFVSSIPKGLLNLTTTALAKIPAIQSVATFKAQREKGKTIPESLSSAVQAARTPTSGKIEERRSIVEKGLARGRTDQEIRQDIINRQAQELALGFIGGPEGKVVSGGAKKVVSKIIDPVERYLEKHVSFFPEEKVVPLKEKVYSKLSGLMTSFIDRANPIVKIGREGMKTGKLMPGQNPEYLARSYLGAKGVSESKLYWNTTKMLPTGDLEITGEGLAPILNRFRGNLNDIRALLIAERDLELAGRSIEGTTPVESRKVLTTLYKKYGSDVKNLQSVAKEIRDYGIRSVINPLRDSGFLSADDVSRIESSNQFYTPFKRVMDDLEESGFVPKSADVFQPKTSGLKTIKGSERKIVDPLESIISDTYRVTDTVMRHNVARSIVDMRNLSPELKSAIVPIPPKMIPVATTEEGKKIFRPSFFNPDTNTMTVFENGVRKFYKIEPELFKALSGMTQGDMGIAMKILSSPARALRAGATGVPEFAIRNAWKDQFSSFVQSKYGYRPFVDLVPGIFSLVKRDDLFWKWMASGASQSMFVSLDRATQNKQLQDILSKRISAASTPQQAFDRFMDIAKHPLAPLQALSTGTESGTRIGLFNRALKSGAEVLPKELQPLAEEARKYKSAEEFVKTQPTYYHSTSADAAKSIEQSGFKAQIGERSLGVANAKGVWLYEDAGATKEFGKNFTRAGKTPSVVETKVSGKIFDATSEDRSIRAIVEDKALISKLRAEGYVGVKGDELGTSATFVFDETALKTKSQLTDLWKRARAPHVTDIEAMFESRDTTVDFGRSGNVGKIINQIDAFFNAAVGSTETTIRRFKERPAATTAKAVAGITIPTISLWIMNKDNPRYKELPEWRKAGFWNFFPTGEDDGPIISLPKPFILGQTFGTVPEQILNWIYNEDPSSLSILPSSLVSSVRPGILPTIATPIIENTTNYSFFRDRPILSQSISQLPAEYQANTYTSDTAKLIGKLIKRSPAKIENLITGYFAGMGNYALDVSDGILKATGIVEEVPQPLATAADIPFIRAFVSREPIGPGSASVDKFFDVLSRADSVRLAAKKLSESGDSEGATKILEENPEAFLVTGMNKVARDMADIRRKKDSVIGAKDISPAEKRAVIDALDELTTEMAQQALIVIEAASQ